ncbi:unnamed protein product, partial [Closterium sp. NIES-54]
YLGLQITRDRARRTITLTQSHMVQQVLQRFGFTYSSPQATPLPTRHSLSALPSDESVESSGPYAELVGCLMYLMTCTRPDLAYPLSILVRYVALGRHRAEHMAAAKRVLRYLCSTSGMGLVLGGRSPLVLTGHADASWADDQATQRSSQGYTFGIGSGSVSWRATRSSSVLGSSCEAEIYAGAMAAQELRWLTYLLTDLGEPPRSPPVLYVDNKAMLALCREQRLEHWTKHIALRYFLARELLQRGQLRLAYEASEANTADVFTKALAPCDHQRCCTQLGLRPLGPSAATTTATTTATTATTALAAATATAAATAAPAVSLFDLTSGAATAPPATADSATRSQWLTRDAAARLAICNHLSLAKCAHFGQHRTAQTLYDAVVARYSSPATAALGRLLLTYLFPKLSAFATVEDLPPMFITFYFIVSCLPDSLRSVRDHFLSLDPTSLTVELLEQHLLAAKTSAVAVGAARGTPRPPFFEGCSPSPLAPSYASAAAADVSVAEDVRAASTSAKRCSSKGKGGRGGGGGSSGGGGGSGSGGGGSSGGGGGRGGGGGSGTGGRSGGSGGSGGGSSGSGGSGGGGTGGGRTGPRRGGPGGGQRQHQQRRSKTQTPQQLSEWLFQRGKSGDLLRSGVALFDLDYDAILSAMYALSASAEGDCYRCVPPDPGIAAAALGASDSRTLPGTAPAQALHTFTFDSGTSCYFFRDSTTLTPLPTPVPIRLADPSGGPVMARSTTVLPCLAVPFGSLSGLHLPSFSTNLVSTAALQDGGQRVSICTCTQTGRHLATFTRRPGSSLYTLATKPPQVAASAQVSAPGQVAASCRTRLFCGTTAWSLPPLPPSPAPPCLPCIEGLQRSAPHSSSFTPTTAPLQTLHMDVWGPARVSGQGRERYFLLVVDDYTRYTMVFPLRSKGQVVDVLIPWIRTVRLQLRERFRHDLPVLRLHFDRGGEFSSDFLHDFCRGEGILQSFTLPDSPQQNGIAERRIGLVMEVTRTSMIHASASHFLWPFVVRYAAHQLNLLPRVSLPETSPTLRWTGEVGDVSVFRVWGSRAFVRDTSADKLSARAIPCVFLGFVPDAPGWQFYHPTSRRVLPSQDDTFPFTISSPIALPLPHPRRSSLLPVPLRCRLMCYASGGAAFGGAEPGGAESEGAGSRGAEPEGEDPGGAEPAGVEPGGAEPKGVEPGGAESESAESGGAKPRGAALSKGPAGASPQLSPQQLREWLVQRACLRSGATGAGGAGDARARGAGVTAGVGGTEGSASASPGGARSRGAAAARTGGVGGAGAGDPTEPGAAGAGGSCAGGAGAGGVGAEGAGVGGTSVGSAGAAGARAIDPGARGVGGIVRPRPYFVPLLQQVLRVPSSTSLTPPLLCPPPEKSQPPLLTASPLPAPPYTEQSGGLTERREPASCPVSRVRTARGVPRSRPPPVPGTHAMALRPSSVQLRVPLPAPPESSLPEVPDPESDCARAASPTVSRLLATSVTDPSFESATAFALVAELLDFAAAYRLDYATALVAESAFASPPSVGGECALGTDVLEDRQEDFECLAAAESRFASMLIVPEADLDAPDIPTTRSYAEAITGTYVDEVPPPGANIVDGMLIFRVKWPLGSPPAFKARNVPRGFNQRLGFDYFQTFSPTPKMTTLRVLLHIAAQCDYKLHSLDFNTAFLQGSLHEEIWLRRPPGFTGSFPTGIQTTLAALGFAPSTTDWSLFLCTDTLLSPFYVLVYVDDLILQRFGFQFSSPQPTPLSTSHSLSAPPSDKSVEPSGLVLGGRGPVVLTGHEDASWVDDSAPQRSSLGYTFCLGSGSVSWRSTHLSSVLSSSCEAEIYAGAMAAHKLCLLTYLLSGLGELPRSPPVLYVDNKAMIALCHEHRLDHRTKHIALRYFLARELQQRGQLRLEYVSTRANSAVIFTKALPPGDHQCFSTVLGIVSTLPH